MKSSNVSYRYKLIWYFWSKVKGSLVQIMVVHIQFDQSIGVELYTFNAKLLGQKNQKIFGMILK